MKEIGEVIDKERNILKVKLNAVESCRSCGLCKTNEDFILEVLDECNAKIGDFVLVEIKKENYYKVTFLVYLFPLILFILGTIIGYIVGEKYNLDPQLLGFALGMIFLAVSYIMIRFIDKKSIKKEKIIPVAKKVV